MSELARYDAARKALAEATRIDDVKAIHDKSVAVRTYAKQRKDPDLLIPAIDICKRAETRAGELLSEMARTGERADHPGVGRGKLPTLSDLGVTKTQSSRWQAFAALPVEIREAKIALAKKKAISAIDGSSKRTRAEMRVDDEARVAALAPVPGKFKTLIFDPPWDYEWLSVAGRAAPGYATMTHDELKSLGDDKLTKTTGALLVAVRDHVEQLVGGKHVDAGRLRLTVAARQEQARGLIGAGLTHREAAKQLGMHHRTIQKDLAPKAPPMAPKAPTKPTSDPEEERKQQRWAANELAWRAP